MKNKSNLSMTRIILMGLLLLAVDSSLAQTAINWHRMQRDLDIMEGVLNKLLTSRSRTWGSNARGLYFDGYGVIFQVDENNAGLDYRVVIEEAVKARDRARDRERVRRARKNDEAGVIVDARGERVEKYKIAQSERVEKLKKRCTEFLANYADALGQLKPSDTITVLINLNGRGSAFYTLAGNEINATAQPTTLTVSAKKSDIIAYRHGRIDSKGFHKRVVVNEKKIDEQMQQNIDIMAQIMDTAMGRKYQADFSVSENRGVYVKGLGALFFLKGEVYSGRPSTWAPAVLENYLKEQEVSVAVSPRKKSKKSSKEIFETFVTALIEIVGDYGHTLRTLAPEENVIVSVAFDQWDYALVRSTTSSGNSSASFSLPSQFVLKAPKSLLDKYNRGELDLAALEKKVTIQKY